MKKILLTTTALALSMSFATAETLLDKASKEKKSHKQSVSNDDLTKGGGNNMLSAIGKIPGVFVQGNQNGSLGNVTIRGYGNPTSNLGTQKVTTAVDGVTSLSEGYRMPSFFGDVSLYKRADVTVGSGVSKIGAGIAGDVNFVTKDAKDLLNGKNQAGKVSTGFSTNQEEKSISATYAQKFNSKTSAFVNYSTRRSEDVKTGGGEILKDSKTNNVSWLTKINAKAGSGDIEFKAAQFKYGMKTRKYPAFAPDSRNPEQHRDVKTGDYSVKYSQDLSGKFNKVTFIASRNDTGNKGFDERKYKHNQFELLTSGSSGINTFNVGLQRKTRHAREIRSACSALSRNAYGQSRDLFYNDAKMTSEGVSKSGKTKTHIVVGSGRSASYEAVSTKYTRSGSSGSYKYTKSTSGTYYKKADGTYSTTAQTATHYKLQRSEGVRDSLNGHEDITGVFVENKMKLNPKTSLILGARIDKINYKAGNQAGQAFSTLGSKNATKVRAKAFYSVNSNTVIRAGVSRAQQPLGVRNVFYRGAEKLNANGASTVKYGTTAIDSIYGSLKNATLPSLTTYEVGARYAKDNVTFDATIYRNKMKNEIIRSRSSYVADSKTSGFDGMATIQATPKLAFKTIFQQNKGEYTSGSQNGKLYSGVSPDKLVFSAIYKPTHNSNIELLANRVGEMKYQGYNARYQLVDMIQPSYTTFDAYVTYLTSNNGRLRIGITNIGNKKYKVYQSFVHAKGRDISIKLDFDF